MRVLYWGNDATSPIPYYRGGMFGPHFPPLGIEPIYAHYEDLDLSLLDRTDIVVFRRWYAARNPAGQLGVDPLTTAAWERAGEIGIGRVYDTDDYDLGPLRRDNPQGRLMTAPGVPELIARMLREADLVTVSTPALAARYTIHVNHRLVILRNAVDRSLYVTDEPEIIGPPRGVFYGSGARLRDFFGEYDGEGHWQGGYAYAAAKANRLSLIWLGDDGRWHHQPREFDRIVPYIRDIPLFARTLTGLHALIGFAPLLASEFDACKSELHWLDMSAAGIPVIAERMMGGGPYGVIHHGQDGLLARGRAEWEEAVRRLLNSAALRSDLVDAAQVRLDTEYSPPGRAAEWAQAFASLQ